MASGTSLLSGSTLRDDEPSEASSREILAALGLALAFVVATRWPVARAIPIETDEFGFLSSRFATQATHGHGAVWPPYRST